MSAKINQMNNFNYQINKKIASNIFINEDPSDKLAISLEIINSASLRKSTLS